MISPEGCASILWRSSENAAEAADALKLTAQDLLRLKIVDRVLEEPLGGAHRNPERTIAAVGDAIEAALLEIAEQDGPTLCKSRREKFLAMGRDGVG